MFLTEARFKSILINWQKINNNSISCQKLTKGEKENPRLQYSTFFYEPVEKTNLIIPQVHSQGIYLSPEALCNFKMAENHFKSFLMCSANQPNLQAYLRPKGDLLRTIFSQLENNPYMGGSIHGFASLLSSSVVQNGQPETSGSRYQRSNVSLESHSRGHGEGFTSATPRSTERGAKPQLIQRAPDGRCQQRSIWEGISHSGARTCVCQRVSVCARVDKMKENSWEEAQFARVWGRESMWEPVRLPSLTLSGERGDSLFAGSNRSWGRPLISRQQEWGGWGGEQGNN